ncbi:unnamed protein product [Camellia sinensis]
MLCQTKPKSDGDVFHEVLNGKPKTCKQIITELDAAKKSTTYKVSEGDLLQDYKTFTFILKVEPKGQNNLVTWTLEYEKLNEQIDDPNSMMDTVMAVCKDIETYHLKEKEMGLKGKIERQMEIKSDGDVFHEVLSARPHHIHNMSPDHVQSVELLEGQWGTPGCVIFWKYTHEGKPKTCKQIITELDVAKKSTTYKVVEGDLLQEYKTFAFILKVEPKGQNKLVTWTLEYEKLNEQIDDPNSLMDTVMTVSQDIETYLLK